MQPLLVRGGGGQLGLDLLVVDDPALSGVDQEHLPRLQPAFLHHLVRGNVEDTDLRGHDDQAVVGHPVTGRTQSITVEHRADDRTVGEGDRRRAVPRLHQRRVELVEGPPGRVHLVVVLPRLRDHHEDRVREAAPGQVEQFQDLVEAGRVAGAVRADGEDPAEVTRDQVAGEQRLPGLHPVTVAAHGVDLTVVGDEPVGVRQRPAREGVGGEPAVHEGDGAGEPGVVQVGEVRRELVGGEHALVDDGAHRQGGEVHPGLPAGPLAHAERPALQVQQVEGLVADAVTGAVAGTDGPGQAEEDLPHPRLDIRGGPADHVADHRHLTPAQDPQALRADDPADRADRVVPVACDLRQKRGTHRVPAGWRQREIDDVTQEGVGDLQQDARTVPGVRVAPGSTTMIKVTQHGEALFDQFVTTPPTNIDDEPDPAGIVLERGVVQTLCDRHPAGPVRLQGISKRRTTLSGRAAATGNAPAGRNNECATCAQDPP